MKRHPLFVILAVLMLTAVSGCQTLQEFANLRNVRFDFERVSGVNLAGIDMGHRRSYGDFTAPDLLKLGRAVAQRKLPVSFDVNLSAQNPQENRVDARLLRMDWVLFVDDKETIRGVYNNEVRIPSGGTQAIPIRIEMDLVDFFGDNLQNLVEVALGISGYGREAVQLKLQARPVIETPLGPIQYPQAITLVRKDVGQRSGASASQ